jgi:hypothetical protein
MSFPMTKLFAALALAALTGCAGTAPSHHTAGPGMPAASANSFVLDRTQLGEIEGTLLGAMIGRVPGLRVDKSFVCPALSLRGSASSVPGITDPLVYVDGTRTMDTCVLEMLRAADVERVEVYPMGVTSRPGYRGHGHGLILVFMRER